MTRSFFSRSGLITVAVGIAGWLMTALGAPAPAAARTYTLPDLLDLAKKQNPGLAAGAAQTASIEAQLKEAHRSWFPTGELVSLIAPSPEIRCQSDPPPGVDPETWRLENCSRTNGYEASLNLKGIFTRTEVRLVQPVYTFGKISAGVDAAEAGIAASRSREQGLVAELELNVRRAYWGAKLAREIVETLKEGVGYLDEAKARIEKDLAAGSGTATPADRHRLNTVRAEVDARMFEAQKLVRVAEGGLRALIGPEAPNDIQLDAEPLSAVQVTVRPLASYEEQARLSRPEVKALDHLLISKRALADFERRKQYPDVVLLGTATFAFANSVDNPKNAFFNDPFNTVSAGLAAALRIPLDLGVKNARAHKVNAEAQEALHRRREALGGIAFEVARAHADLIEAQERRKVMQAGEKTGRQWVTTTKVSFDAGLAETKDFADALAAYFQFRIKALQATFDLNMAAATLGRAVGADVTR
jgi:outer membrane protein